MRSETSNRHRRAAGSKTFTIVGFALTMVALLLLFWWHNAMVDPDVKIPTHAMPANNAYDGYVSAGNKTVNDGQVGYAISTVHTNSDVNDHEYTLAAKQKLVVQNSAALQTLRAALPNEFMHPQMRSYNSVFPELAGCRRLARLLELEAQTMEAKGDWNGALSSLLDAIKMGEEMPRGSPMIGRLVGEAVQAIGRVSSWQVIDHLDAKQAKAAANRMEAILSRHVSYTAILQEEKWGVQASMKEMFRDPKLASQLVSQNTNAPNPSISNALSPLFFLIYSKRRILQNYTNYMDGLIANSRQPYAAHPPDPPAPNDPVNQVMVGLFSNAYFMERKGAAQNGMLLLTIALRAYNLDHHAYPETLSALAPTYLHQLPDDPFAMEGTFRYKRRGGRYLLYSIGPDGIDDGGRLIDDHSKVTKQKNYARYRVEVVSVGDIVAGKNIK